MNKLIAGFLIASATLVGSANATPWVQTYHEECTTTYTSANPPSGTYEAPNGHKWAGFKQDGTPPDSLSSGGSSSTTCITVADQAPI